MYVQQTNPAKGEGLGPGTETIRRLLGSASPPPPLEAFLFFFFSSEFKVLRSVVVASFSRQLSNLRNAKTAELSDQMRPLCV